MENKLFNEHLAKRGKKRLTPDQPSTPTTESGSAQAPNLPPRTQENNVNTDDVQEPPTKRQATVAAVGGPRKALHYSEVDIENCFIEHPVKNAGGTISMFAHPPDSDRGDIEFQLARLTDPVLTSILWYYPPKPGNPGFGTVEIEVPTEDQQNFLIRADNFAKSQIEANHRELRKELRNVSVDDIINNWYKGLLRQPLIEGDNLSIRASLDKGYSILVTDSEPTDKYLNFRRGTVEDLKPKGGRVNRCVSVHAFKSVSIRGGEAKASNLVVRTKKLIVFPPDPERPPRYLGVDVDLGDDVRVEITENNSENVGYEGV